MWLFRSLEYIDFSKKRYLSEAINISIFTQGGIGLKDIKEMDLDEYNLLLEECSRLKDEIENG